MTLPPGGPIPSLNVTRRLMKVGVSSTTVQSDMGLMKISGL